MKKRIAILFSGILFCICTMLCMVGCDSENFNEYNENYPVTVTYYFNEGKINSYPKETYLNLHYSANAYIVAPGTVTIFPEVQRTGYFVNGWYYAETDAQGNVVKDENGYVLSSGKKFDFSSTRVNENLALVPGWTHNVKVVFEGCTPYSDKDFSVKISDGEKLEYPSYEKTKKGAWIKGYYWDDSFTEAIVFGKDGLDVYALLERTNENTPVDDEGCLELTVYTKYYSVEVQFIDTITNNRYTMKIGANETLLVPTEEEFFRGKSEFYLSHRGTEYSDEIDLTNGKDFDELTKKLPARPTLSEDKESMILEIYVK